MAIALVQIKTAAGTSLTLNSATTAGNCLVVGFTDEAGASSVTAVTLGGTAGNFAQLVAAAGAPGKGGEVLAALWADPNCAGGQTAVAITASGNVNPTMWAAEFSGIVASSPLDKQAGTTGTATSWSSGATATTTQAAELWIGAGCVSASNAVGPSSPWNNTNVSDASGDSQVYGYQIVSSTGTATYSGTGAGVNQGWAAAVATLKGAASSAPSGTVQPRAAVPAPRRRLARAWVQFRPVTTANATGQRGTVQPRTAVPAPRRRPARAWVRFIPVKTANATGAAGKVQPLTAVPAPRRKPARAWVRFIPVTTANATGAAGKVQPRATVPVPRRRLARAWVRFTPVRTVNAPPSRDLLISLAAQSGTDDYQNSYPKGIKVGGSSASSDIEIIPGATGQASEILFASPAPGVLSNSPNIAAGIGGAAANFLISGPALSTAGHKDWVQLFLLSNDGGGTIARCEFRYIDDAGGIHIIASWDGNGWAFASPAVFSGAVEVNNNLTVDFNVFTAGLTVTGGSTFDGNIDATTSTLNIPNGTINLNMAVPANYPTAGKTLAQTQACLDALITSMINRGLIA